MEKKIIEHRKKINYKDVVTSNKKFHCVCVQIVYMLNVFVKK